MEERKVISKMSDKTVAVVTKTEAYIHTNPELTYMEILEFKNDKTLAQTLLRKFL